MHVSGLVTSAVLVGALLYAVAHLLWGIPQLLYAAIALVLAVFASGVLPVPLPGSRLRVPQSWFQFGDMLYSAAFGIALGSGVLTALSSPGYYAVVAWGLSGEAWRETWPVFVAFAAGRALIFAVNIGTSRKPKASALETVDRSVAITGHFRWLECAVLASVGMLLLLSN